MAAADELDQILIRTDLVTVGRFRCPVDHPRFRDSGPIKESCVVFPRSSVLIAHEGRRPFVTDSTIATLYNAGQRYERMPVSPEGDRCDWFAVSTSTVRDIVMQIDPGAAEDPARAVKHEYAPVSSAMYLEQRRLQRTIAAEADPLATEETVLSLVERMLLASYRKPAHPTRSALGPRAGRQRAAIADAARTAIAKSFSTRITLTALSRSLGCSPFHLSRSFREVTGHSLHAHVTSLRLRAALERLESGCDLSTVALDSGFSSHSHFTSVFRRFRPSAVARF